ncbi:hypothetical protein GCM10007298_07060 [Williamsia phyllosphaerae]|uniref:Uncharacterized protein n=1 Tax=Williamsia phyllosphaerae TaxID=885042 RepID=A0ABQ1U9C5_9NOCA|nr:hypothetical protein GCM10007298_07060 [Williamsia phyllosphaerae]
MTGQFVGEPGADGLRGQLGVGRDDRGEELDGPGGLVRDDRGVGDSVDGDDRRLDLARFHTEPVDGDLVVGAADVEHRPGGVDPAEVAGAVET